MSRGSRIPVGKRIINSVPPLDPTDLSEANALNLMFIWDNMGTGDYIEDASIAGRHVRQLFAREQAVPNLTLEVLAGIAWYAQNTNVIFAGGNSPVFSAPISNPRIDILTLRSDGNLYVLSGVENASPTPPTIPSTDIPIAQVYNVVGQTVIHDNDAQVVGQGYIQYDLRPFVQIAVGSSAMPKIGLVARVRVSTTSNVLSDVVNFTGAGRFIGLGTNIAGGSDNPDYEIIVDGVTYTAALVGAAAGDYKFQLLAGDTATMFEVVSGSATYEELFSGIFFKTSLRIRHRSGTGGGTRTITTTLVYEHE